MRKVIIKIAISVFVILLIVGQAFYIQSLRDKTAILTANTTSLLTSVEQYKVADSLNAVKVHGLNLQLSEYERYRARDQALIEELRVKNKNLHQIVSTNVETINQLKGDVRDTVIYVIDKDTVYLDTKVIEVDQPWVQMSGVIQDNEFVGTVRTIDSLIITEQIQYKRFLGFLWKTRRVKDREFDVVSRNPNTVINDFEVITIYK